MVLAPLRVKLLQNGISLVTRSSTTVLTSISITVSVPRDLALQLHNELDFIRYSQYVECESIICKGVTESIRMEKMGDGKTKIFIVRSMSRRFRTIAEALAFQQSHNVRNELIAMVPQE